MNSLSNDSFQTTPTRLLLLAGMAMVTSSLHAQVLPNDTLFGLQWHLDNTGQLNGIPGEDLNVLPVWNIVGGAYTGYTGDGVVIGIVDEGVEYTHPDLSGNYDDTLDFDYFGNDNNPFPSNGEFHGTSVAGVAAGVGNNGLGTSGVAPEATIASIRFGNTDTAEGNALSHLIQDIDIYNNSWGPFDNGSILEGPGTQASAALLEGITDGRGGLGVIYVWAAGNGGLSDMSNKDGYANSRFTIAVTAVDNRGNRSSYGEVGGNIFVAAPSDNGNVGIATADRTGTRGYGGISGFNDYTDNFGGTSSASPAAAGAIALVLEANPMLSYRDVQHVLAHTARQNDVADSTWRVNAAGHDYSSIYGFGTIDAFAATSLAETWVNVREELEIQSDLEVANLAIPDGVGSSFGATASDSTQINQVINIEWAEVTIELNHTYRGDLQIELVSPGGSTSLLVDVHGDSNNNYNWVFTSANFWDESSQGEWTLQIADGFGGDTGTLSRWQLDLFGTGQDGDANLDGMVDLLDLDILGANYNGDGDTWYDGDFNNDDVVNLLDLDIIGANWGFGTTSAMSFAEALTASGISVPEPGSALLMLTGLSLAARRRR